MTISKQALKRLRSRATIGSVPASRRVCISGPDLIAMLDEIETARLAAQERARP